MERTFTICDCLLTILQPVGRMCTRIWPKYNSLHPPFLGVYDLWAGRVRNRATPAVSWGLDIFCLIRMTPRPSFNMDPNEVVWKKRSMSHIAHLKYLFKSINIWVKLIYIITSIRRRKSPLSSIRNWMVLIIKHWVHLTQRCCVLNLVGQVILEKKIVELGYVFLTFRNYVSFK